MLLLNMPCLLYCIFLIFRAIWTQLHRVSVPFLLTVYVVLYLSLRDYKVKSVTRPMKSPTGDDDAQDRTGQKEDKVQ